MRGSQEVTDRELRELHHNNIDAVADLVQSQEDRPQTHHSVRQISHETHI